MSDNVLKLVPVDKTFLPNREMAEKARLLLESFFPDGEQAEIEFSDSLQFIDGGENLERIKCPFCKVTIEINQFKGTEKDIEWWRTLDRILSESPDINSLSVEMPCCGELSLVQNIDFLGLVGFSKFELCIWNPNDEMTEDEMKEIEKLLGCELKSIWAHY